MRISVNIITQNRAKSLLRLLTSLRSAYYLGDEVPISFNMDSRVDAATLKVVNSFDWPHGPKTLRRRIIQGGLIRAVSESWYPSSNEDYGSSWRTTSRCPHGGRGHRDRWCCGYKEIMTQLVQEIRGRN